MTAPDNADFHSPRSYRPFPVLTRAENEAEGAALVREFPSPEGVLLHGALRDVMLWLQTDADARAAAFPPGSGERRRRAVRSSVTDGRLARPLLALARLTDEPARTPPARVARACARIAAWAAGKDAPHTELAFTQALALAEPGVPRHALLTGRLARDLAQYPRAETWLRHAIKLARGRKEWATYVDAFLALGTFYIRTGNLPAARVVLDRALTGARRWRLRELEGVAHQDFFHLNAEAGELRKAYEHAKAAHEAYGTAEEYLARLAADLALFWIHLGCYARAASLFEAIIDRAPDHTIRAFWTAHLVHAAALAGRREQYESARSAAIQAIPRSTRPVRTAECYVLLALADLAMHEWERAARTAREASSRASAVGAAEMQLMAEEALTQAEQRRLVARGSAELAETPGLARVADRLARQLAEAVAA